MASTDIEYMKIALGLAKRGLGNVAPNPAVGCLLVKNGILYGAGWTQPGGRPHAETVALKQAGKHAKGSTAYVTLEPCAHYGQTPPCAKALIEAGVAKVFVATVDPDPRVKGQGSAMLKQAGIDVIEGICEQEARLINRGFFLSQTEKRPLVTLKIAATLDSKIATQSGESKWITGPLARAHGHRQRAAHDAILVGVETVLADNPSLDCRLAGLEGNSPRPIIMDSTLRTPISAAILKRRPIIICNSASCLDANIKNLKEAGGIILPVENTQDIRDVCEMLVKQGITRLLIEGGATIATSFLRARCVDDILLYSAPKIIGSEGKSAISGLGLAELAAAPHFTLTGTRKLGPDLLASYRKAG